ncbi:unnamed protein product, partial [Gulo gulo]
MNDRGKERSAWPSAPSSGRCDGNNAPAKAVGRLRSPV